MQEQQKFKKKNSKRRRGRVPSRRILEEKYHRRKIQEVTKKNPGKPSKKNPR